MVDSYMTVSKSSTFEFIEKKSKFIAYVQPIQCEKDALDFINNIKTKHWDARHNVYAYVLLDNNISRYSDDGEPHGTAGVPVLDILKKNNLYNVAIVVTRYFGGILLGTGGLVRAYSAAATGAINASGIIKMSHCFECELLCDYNQYGKISNIINECGGIIINTDFTQEINVCFYLKKENLSILSKKILEMSSGALNYKIINEKFYNI